MAETKTGKSSVVGMHIVGPANGKTAEELDRMDADDRREHDAWASMRDTVVSIGKRYGVLKQEAPRAAPQVGGEEGGEIVDAITDFTSQEITPPFDFRTLAAIYENSNSLRQNIDAMATNIDGFGHTFDPILDFTDPDVRSKVRDILFSKKLDDSESAPADLMDLEESEIETLEPTDEEVDAAIKKWSRVASIERGRLKTFFNSINPLAPMTEIRLATREELELMGNAAWEVIREDPTDISSKISQVYQTPFVSMKLMRVDSKPTTVRMPVRVHDIFYEEVEVSRFFRRFKRETGRVRTFYKEFGDPRVLSRKTGKFYETIEGLHEDEGPDALPANELYHWKIRSPITPYGVPRWVGALLSVLGSRAAEEVNFLYFDNKAIPPMLLMVSGGRVSEESVTKIESYIENRIKGRENFHKIMVLEGLPADADVSEGEIEHSGKMRIELKPLMGEMQQDALFQNYDANNITKVGRSFRQPQLLTGQTKDMNRSTAEVAKAFAEEQIYQPGRDSFDNVMNRHFVPNLKVHFWRFATRAPVQRIPNDLVENTKKSLDSGAMTPNEGRKLLSDAFSIELGHISDPWGDMPPKLARTGLRGSGIGISDLTPSEVLEKAEDGDLVARGKTEEREGHSHTFVALRDGDGIRVMVMPGGEDGHTHSGPLVEGAKERSTLDLTVGGQTPEEHPHTLSFDIPLTRRKMQARAAGLALHALREAIREELEFEKTEWLGEIDRDGLGYDD